MRARVRLLVRAVRSVAGAARPARRVALVGVVALAACSPYDPSLPGTPFLCGDREPRCPDGYACVTDPEGRMVCRAEPVSPDAGIPDATRALTGP